MTTIKDIYEYIDRLSPFSLQESYDNSGLIIGSMNGRVKKILTALDITEDIAIEATENNVDLIVTHHPVIFRAVKRIDTATPLGLLLRNDISVISAHTNFDSAVMNDILCQTLGLVPVDNITVENGAPIGCICEIEETEAGELARKIKNALGNKVVRSNTLPKKRSGGGLKKIAVCSGSGGSFLGDVLAKGCDGFITGDVKHDIFIDAHNAGLTVFDAGHFHTENIFCEYMKNALEKGFPEVKVSVAETNEDILRYTI